MRGSQVLSVCVVLEQCVDQLAVLGHLTVESRTNQKQGEWQEEHRAKVDRDRQGVSRVLSRVLGALADGHMEFSPLLEEAESRAGLRDIISSAEEGFRRTEQLQKHLHHIQHQSSLDLQRREKEAALLRDELQEAKGRDDRGRSYASASSRSLRLQTTKLSGSREAGLQNRSESLLAQREEEGRSHQESISFLKEQQGLLGERLEVLMLRYEEVLKEKQEELSSLKTSRTHNLQLLQELATKYRECQQVVIQDRVDKENLLRRREEEELQNRAATKVQAWWRGCAVRRGPMKTKDSRKKKKKKKKT